MGPSTLIAARPHFRKHGSELRFFLSSRAWHSLSPSEETIWAGLSEGPATLESLADTAAVGSLVKAGVAEAIEPVVAPDRRRVLVVEPHSDDAALSIGGTMWKMRNDLEFHLLTMASRSNYTSNFHLDRDYFDRSEITKMRALEGELFTMHLGGACHCAGMAEATLRYAVHDWDRDFFLEHKAP